MCSDIDQIHLGPEAGKLITALQEFISSIVVRSQSGGQNTIVDVSFDEGRLYAWIIYAMHCADAVCLLEDKVPRADPQGVRSDLDNEGGTRAYDSPYCFEIEELRSKGGSSLPILPFGPRYAVGNSNLGRVGKKSWSYSHCYT